MGRSGDGKRDMLLGWPDLLLKFADVTGHQFNVSTRGLITIILSMMLFILVIWQKYL